MCVSLVPPSDFEAALRSIRVRISLPRLHAVKQRLALRLFVRWICSSSLAESSRSGPVNCASMWATSTSDWAWLDALEPSFASLYSLIRS